MPDLTPTTAAERLTVKADAFKLRWGDGSLMVDTADLRAVLAERLAALAEIDRLRRNMQRMVSGFRSHLTDEICRIGPARLPMDIKDSLESMHDNYNAWADKSAESERDAVLAENARLRAALEDLIPRFRGCCIASGSDPEFADLSVSAARAALTN